MINNFIFQNALRHINNLNFHGQSKGNPTPMLPCLHSFRFLCTLSLRLSLCIYCRLHYTDTSFSGGNFSTVSKLLFKTLSSVPTLTLTLAATLGKQLSIPVDRWLPSDLRPTLLSAAFWPLPDITASSDTTQLLNLTSALLPVSISTKAYPFQKQKECCHGSSLQVSGCCHGNWEAYAVPFFLETQTGVVILLVLGEHASSKQGELKKVLLLPSLISLTAFYVRCFVSYPFFIAGTCFACSSSEPRKPSKS
uniref:Uncharacterized protein n=1 Tax=Salvator merianae TaxID=96440 RepID=A0A8D0KMX4_SALMN